MKPIRIVSPSSLVTVAVIAGALLSTASPAQQETGAPKAPKSYRPPMSVEFEIDGNPIALRVDANGAVIEATGGVEVKRYKSSPVHDVAANQVMTRILDKDATPIALVSADQFGVSIRFALRSDRPWVGMDLEPAPAALAEHLDLEPEQVSIVAGVRNDSPAAKSELRMNDIVIAVDGKSVANVDEVRRAVAERKPGDTLVLTVLRKGKRRDVTITIGRAPLAGPSAPNTGMFGDFGSPSRARLLDLAAHPQFLARSVDTLAKDVAEVADLYAHRPGGGVSTVDSSAGPGTATDTRLESLEQRLVNIEAMLEKLTKARKDD